MTLLSVWNYFESIGSNKTLQWVILITDHMKFNYSTDFWGNPPLNQPFMSNSSMRREINIASFTTMRNKPKVWSYKCFVSQSERQSVESLETLVCQPKANRRTVENRSNNNPKSAIFTPVSQIVAQSVSSLEMS